jgi:hypothetical protein
LSEDLLKQVMKEILLVEMKFTAKGGFSNFAVYAHLEDAEKMLGFIKELIKGITTKVKEDLEKTNMVIPKDAWDEWNRFWEHTPQQIENLTKIMTLQRLNQKAKEESSEGK